MNKLGTFIKNRRKELGLSQKQISDAIAVSRQYICSIEKGKLPLAAHHANTVSFLLQSSLDEIVALHVEDCKTKYLSGANQ